MSPSDSLHSRWHSLCLSSLCGRHSLCLSLLCGRHSVSLSLLCGRHSLCLSLLCGRQSLCLSLLCGRHSLCLSPLCGRQSLCLSPLCGRHPRRVTLRRWGRRRRKVQSPSPAQNKSSMVHRPPRYPRRRRRRDTLTAAAAAITPPRYPRRRRDTPAAAAAAIPSQPSPPRYPRRRRRQDTRRVDNRHEPLCVWTVPGLMASRCSSKPSRTHATRKPRALLPKPPTGGKTTGSHKARKQTRGILNLRRSPTEVAKRTHTKSTVKCITPAVADSSRQIHSQASSTNCVTPAVARSRRHNKQQPGRLQITCRAAQDFGFSAC